MWPLASLFALLTIGLIGALSELKRWAGRWGTRPEELARVWPGDELSPHATAVTTRAISIAAPADTVWAWLVQIGPIAADSTATGGSTISSDAKCPVSSGSCPNGNSARWATSSGWRGPTATTERRGKRSCASIADARCRSPHPRIGGACRHETSAGGTWTFILVPLTAQTTRLVRPIPRPEAPTLLGRLFWLRSSNRRTSSWSGR